MQMTSGTVTEMSPEMDAFTLVDDEGEYHTFGPVVPADLMEVVGEFGRGGRQAGQFLRPHGMSVDSRGNLYVGEASTGRRVQKFTVH